MHDIREFEPRREKSLGNIVTQINPPEMNTFDPDKVSRYRRELADYLLAGDGDLNVIQDLDRIKKRQRYFTWLAVFCYLIVILIFCVSAASLGIFIYTYVTGAWFSHPVMKLYGIIASSIIMVYAIITLILMTIDRSRKMKIKSPMSDYRFLLDVHVKQQMNGKDNLLVYSPELFANQIMPKPQINPVTVPATIAIPTIPSTPIAVQSSGVYRTPIQLFRNRFIHF